MEIINDKILITHNLQLFLKTHLNRLISFCNTYVLTSTRIFTSSSSNRSYTLFSIQLLVNGITNPYLLPPTRTSLLLSNFSNDKESSFTFTLFTHPHQPYPSSNQLLKPVSSNHVVRMTSLNPIRLPNFFIMFFLI